MCNMNAKETKRRRILEAAYHLFVKNGYNNTKIIDIAEEAGVGKGTVYEYFDSKATLLTSIISSGIEEYLVEYKEIKMSDMKQADKLKALIRVEAKHIQEHGPRMLKMSQVVFDTSDGMPKEFIEKMKVLWTEEYMYIKDIIDEGIERGEFREMNLNLAAITIMGATSSYLNLKYGVCQLADIESPFNVDELEEEEFIDFLIRGIQL
ncbi:MAG: TetR/AcrR family transcriptional regulator [Aminipila sp.]